MGCDISTVVQIFDVLKKGWDTIDVDVCRDRNYDFFYLLAGIRRNEQNFLPLSEERGLPKDFKVNRKSDPWSGTTITHTYNDKDYWIGDFGFSWFTLDELEKFDYSKCGDNPVQNRLIPVLKEIASKYNANHSHVRFVFGFDN